MSFSTNLEYILKIIDLKNAGYDVIENCDFEIVDKEDTEDNIHADNSLVI